MTLPVRDGTSESIPDHVYRTGAGGGGGGGRCPHFIPSRGQKTIDPRFPTMPGRRSSFGGIHFSETQKPDVRVAAAGFCDFLE